MKYNENEVPKIEIRYQHLAGIHQFYFKDNGIGIPNEYQEKIFEPFQRLHIDKYPGTGLGLSVCQEIVGHLGGTIRIQSRMGEGSTFIISLPEKLGKKLSKPLASYL